MWVCVYETDIEDMILHLRNVCRCCEIQNVSILSQQCMLLLFEQRKSGQWFGWRKMQNEFESTEPISG